MSKEKLDNRPILNVYPDSLGGTLTDITELLKMKDFEDVFASLYILPSMFNTDLDRGFSVIDYQLNEEFVKEEALETLKDLGIELKLDFILNHSSVLSPQFQDLIRNGYASKYKDFFINWNSFWEGQGEMTEDGYIKPNSELIQDMFFRKPGLPILMVKIPGEGYEPYWNTFYQEVKYKEVTAQNLMKLLGIQYTSATVLSRKIQEQLDAGIRPDKLDLCNNKNHSEKIVEFIESGCEYLGQMDLNIKSPLVWNFYKETLKKLFSYGAKIVRLDAFAYCSKEIGKKNFLNNPETWDILEKVKGLADQYGLTLLPEIHATYGDKIHEVLSEKDYMTYDFFLPGLVIDAIEHNNSDYLLQWADEIVSKKMHVVNMLGCHDGIPLLDLKGIISEERIQKLIDIVVSRGGHVKNLHGQKNMYYQVNSTYYSALGEDDKKMLLARAIQMFMPGKPQVWYLDSIGISFLFYIYVK
jgi:sucrose phosphorylase